MSEWPHYKPVVTVADVLESGVCLDGVREWLAKNKRAKIGRAHV